MEWSHIVIGFVAWLPLHCLGISVAEYIAHRWFMHKKTWINRKGYQWHHVEHHGMKINEPYFPYIDQHLFYYLAYGSPMIAFYVVRGLTGAGYAWGGLASLMLVFVVHARLYSLIHRCEHELESNWTERMPGFVAMKRHHLDHHLKPNRNFAVVFLWTDRLFGTYWRSNDPQ